MSVTANLPQIQANLSELSEIKGAWRVALCGDGPLTRAVAAQNAASASPVLVVDDGDDAATLRRLHSLLEGQGKVLPVTLIVHVTDRALARSVENRLFADGISPRPVIISGDDLMAEQAMLQHRLFARAQARGQEKLHVALLGFGTLGRAFLDQLILNGMAKGLDAPAIDIITADVARASSILTRDMPEMAQSADLSVVPLNMEELGHAEKSPIALAEANAPLTAIFILLEDERDTLRAVAEICALQNLHGLAHASVFVGGPGADMAVRLVAPQRNPRNEALSITALDDLASLPDLLDTILVKRDLVARRIHEAYQARYAGQTGAGISWDALSETYRRANRRAAAHLVQKLAALDLDLKPGLADFAAVSPQAYDKVIAPLAKAAVEDEIMRGLARMEHERWCADRRLDGWRYGEVRDDARLFHPSLVDFDDPRLTADEIEKDVAQLRFLLGAVVEAKEGGATPRFTVGIVGGTAQPGIDAKALNERFAAEPERSILLISPLLTAGELNAAAKVMSDLKAANRICRLVIPEWFAGNATLRDPAIEKSETLRALEADPRTWISPIGPQAFSASSDWDEVGVSETQRQALISYVTSRAGVLLSSQS